MAGRMTVQRLLYRFLAGPLVFEVTYSEKKRARTAIRPLVVTLARDRDHWPTSLSLPDSTSNNPVLPLVT